MLPVLWKGVSNNVNVSLTQRVQKGKENVFKLVYIDVCENRTGGVQFSDIPYKFISQFKIDK